MANTRPDGIAIVDPHGIWSGTFVDACHDAAQAACWNLAVDMAGQSVEQLKAAGARLVRVRLMETEERQPCEELSGVR